MKSNLLPLWLIILLVSFPQLGETIYTPSLPNLANSFSISEKLAEWTISIYFLGFAFGVLFWGMLSDYIGRRNSMIWGIIVYIVACIGCLYTHDIKILLFFRFIQTFGASVGSVISQTMVRDKFDDKNRGRIFAIVSSCLAISPAIGPLIGGYINKSLVKKIHD